MRAEVQRCVRGRWAAVRTLYPELQGLPHVAWTTLEEGLPEDTALGAQSCGSQEGTFVH